MGTSPSAGRRLGRGLIAISLILVAGFAGLAWWWTHPADATAVLRSYASPLDRVERKARDDLGVRVEAWEIHDTRGTTVTALWRAAREKPEKAWTAVMLGGLHTGERAVLLLPEDSPVNVLAVDWPWNGPLSLSELEFIGQLPSIRRAVLRSPASVALGVEAVRSQEGIDRTRIVLVGVSLGVAPTLAALRLTDAPSAIALIDGASRLDLLLHRELKKFVGQDWLVRPIASLGRRLIHAVEPEEHAEAVQGLPTLLINARQDERLPKEAIDALWASMPAADRRWREDRHVRAERVDTIEEIVSEVKSWLDTLPR